MSKRIKCRICGKPISEHKIKGLLNPCVIEAYRQGIRK